MEAAKDKAKTHPLFFKKNANVIYCIFFCVDLHDLHWGVSGSQRTTPWDQFSLATFM